MTEKIEFKSVLSNTAFVIKSFFLHMPIYSFVSLLFATFTSILRVFRNTVIVKSIIDAIQYGKDIRSVIIFCVLLFLLSLLQGLTNVFFQECIDPKAKQKMRKKFQKDLFKHAIEMDISCYDNPKFYDEYIFALSQSLNNMWSVFDSVKTVFGSIVSVTTLVSSVFNVDTVGLIIGILSVIISFIFDTWRNNRIYHRDIELIKTTRIQDYICRVYSLPDYSKEIRVYKKVVELLLSKYYEAVNKGKIILKKHSPQIVVSDSLTYFLSTYLLIYGVYCGYLAYKIIVEKSVSIGDFVGLYQAVRLLRNQIMMVTYSAVPNLKKNSLYIGKLRNFLRCKPQITNKVNILAPGNIENLCFDNVSFGYSDEELILKNIFIDIEKYKKIAIVGYNGAGKTTLIKLLMRLYDVSKGKIILNGNNIKNYNINSYRNLFGPVFQDFQIYATTVAENVAMDLNVNEQSAIYALNRSGLERKIEMLEKGLSTKMLREYEEDGILLSGGEMQKLAIARVLYGEYECIIMDEPTSALDPISEYNFNKLVSEITNNKTVIFISHRLSTTVLSDYIYMLEDGKIIEQGTHKDLMKLNGKYADMFNIQAKQYIERK